MRTFQNKVRLCRPANPQGLSMASVPWGPFCLSCAHRRVVGHKPDGENGYCAAYNVGDWMPGGFGMLWDGLKVCDIRRDEEEEAAPVRFARRPRFHQPWPRPTILYERDRAYQRSLPPRRAGWRIPIHRRWGSIPFGEASRSFLVAITSP